MQASLDLAQVEITSDPTHPIEAALLADRTGGWRAAGPGEQTIRLLFTRPPATHQDPSHPGGSAIPAP